MIETTRHVKNYSRLDKIIGQLSPRPNEISTKISQVGVHKLASQNETSQVKAALTIQRHYRGNRGRMKAQEKKCQALFATSFEVGAKLVNHPKLLQQCPRAKAGKTPVYLPQVFPIVVKRSGTSESKDRFRKMEEARAICESNGFKNLVVPEARVVGECIIESRLPLRMDPCKESIGLYVENRDRFTKAVEEFTAFLCQCQLYDIVGGSINQYERTHDVVLGRYDNIALYVEGQGKIGLVDLEQFYPRRDNEDQKGGLSKCMQAVILFPYHLDEIINVAKKFDPKIEEHRPELVKLRDKVIKSFKAIYENHAEFVRKKGITLETPALEKLGDTRIKQIQIAIEARLRHVQGTPRYKDFLGENPSETLRAFNDQAFPKVLEATYKLLHDAMGYRLRAQQKSGSNCSFQQLLTVRSLDISRNHLVVRNFLEKTLPLFKVFRLEEDEKYEVQELVLDVILKELERGGEIAYFNPCFGYSYSRCIFC